LGSRDPASAVDAPPDTPPDAPPDTPPDAPPDAPPDTPPDAIDDWGAAPPIAREPTVILPEPALTDAAPAPAPPASPDASFDAGDLGGDDDGVRYEGAGEIDLTERHADGHWAAAASVRAVRDDGDADADADDSLDGAPGAHDLDDLSVDGPADLGD